MTLIILSDISASCWGNFTRPFLQNFLSKLNEDEHVSGLGVFIFFFEYDRIDVSGVELGEFNFKNRLEQILNDFRPKLRGSNPICSITDILSHNYFKGLFENPFREGGFKLIILTDFVATKGKRHVTDCLERFGEKLNEIKDAIDKIIVVYPSGVDSDAHGKFYDVLVERLGYEKVRDLQFGDDDLFYKSIIKHVR